MSIGIFIKSTNIFLCFFYGLCKKNYMADIGNVEVTRPLDRVVHGSTRQQAPPQKGRSLGTTRSWCISMVGELMVGIGYLE